MKRIVPINFSWEFKPNFNEQDILTKPEGLKTIDIPHTNYLLPYNNFNEESYQFISQYRKMVFIEENKKDIWLVFYGVSVTFKLYINGIYVSENYLPYSEIKIIINDYIKMNEENELLVVVDSREIKDVPPFGNIVDYLAYGGIYREVELIYSDNNYFTDFYLVPVNVLSNPALKCLYTLKNEGIVFLNLYDDDKLIYSKEVKNNEITENLDVVLWDLDNPKLYKAVLSLYEENKLIDEETLMVGFKETQFLPDGFYLNGKKTKLRGLNRHQSYPYVGYAMPKRAQVKDAEILKNELFVNIVRTSHYPQSKHFYDACDKLGLLVFTEIPGWQYIGNADFKERTFRALENMIKVNKNHPSIIMWGVRINESVDDDEFYKKTNELAKIFDPYRPTGGVRCYKKSHLFEDVYTYNDFIHKGKNEGLDDKERVAYLDKPYLVTECNGHMFPTKRFDKEHLRIEHALRHSNVINDSFKPGISGVLSWCMADYNTHSTFGSGDKICYHGVLDMFRIKKLAAYAYISEGTKEPFIMPLSDLNLGEYDASYIKEVYLYSNVDYIKLFKDDKYITTILPAKDRFPNLSHPLFIIKDFIGDSLETEEKLSKNDAKIMKELFVSIRHTWPKINFKDKIKMIYILKRNHLTVDDGINLYNKYSGSWDAKSTYYFKGYINNELVTEAKKEKLNKKEIVIKADDEKLIISDTYDVTRITIESTDQNGYILPYDSQSFVISCNDVLEIIGPKVISLIGGAIGFWIKTKKQGEGIVYINDGENIRTLKIEVDRND